MISTIENQDKRSRERPRGRTSVYLGIDQSDYHSTKGRGSHTRRGKGKLLAFPYRRSAKEETSGDKRQAQRQGDKKVLLRVHQQVCLGRWQRSIFIKFIRANGYFDAVVINIAHDTSETASARLPIVSGGW